MSKVKNFIKDHKRTIIEISVAGIGVATVAFLKPRWERYYLALVLDSMVWAHEQGREPITTSGFPSAPSKSTAYVFKCERVSD